MTNAPAAQGLNLASTPREQKEEVLQKCQRKNRSSRHHAGRTPSDRRCCGISPVAFIVVRALATTLWAASDWHLISSSNSCSSRSSSSSHISPLSNDLPKL